MAFGSLLAILSSPIINWRYLPSCFVGTANAVISKTLTFFFTFSDHCIEPSPAINAPLGIYLRLTPFTLMDDIFLYLKQH